MSRSRISDEERKRRNREAAKRYAARNPEKVRANQRAYYQKNRERILADQRRVRTPEEHRRYTLRRVFWTPEMYAETFEAQGGTCAICGAPPEEGENLHADHCHATKTPRGLLCGPCNRALGGFRDDPGLLRLAAAYVEAHRVTDR